MSSIQITTQSLEHVLSTSTGLWYSVISTGLGSLLAAGIVTLYSEWSLNKRDERLREHQRRSEKSEIESATNSLIDILSIFLAPLGNLKINIYNPIEIHFPLQGKVLRTIVKVSPDALRYINHAFSMYERHRSLLTSGNGNLNTGAMQNAEKYITKGACYAFLALAFLQDTKTYELRIKSKPNFYFLDSYESSLTELSKDLSECFESLNQDNELDTERLLQNYATNRQHLLNQAITKQ